TLIEQAERAFDADEAERMAAKVAGGEDFTLQDFLDQMQQLKKMGSMKKMLGMLPGAGQMREALENFDESEVDRIEAMVRSMTPHERSNPRILNGSRRSRIARGSGTTVAEINQLMERFDQARTMMHQMSRSGGKMPPGGLGPGGLPGGGKKSKGRMAPPPKRGKKGKSGNPAKRAKQEAEAARKASEQPATPSGSAFGLGGQDAGA